MTSPQPIPDPRPSLRPAEGEISVNQVSSETQSARGDGPSPKASTAPRGVSAGESFGSSPIPTPIPMDGPATADFVDLRIWAESFNDAQVHRVALVNRMERGGVDADLLRHHKDLLLATEKAMKLALIRSYRRVIREHMPAVEDWQTSHFGIGAHLLARLLGSLGHPVIAHPHRWVDIAPESHKCDPFRCGKRHLIALQPFERSVSQLWSYCGHGAPVKRRRGMSQEEAFGLGNPMCKKVVHLLAAGTIKVAGAKTHTDEASNGHTCYCIECSPAEDATTPSMPSPESSPVPPRSTATPQEPPAGSPQSEAPTTPVALPVGDKHYYRRIYDTRKVATTDRDWTDGHRHADALRIVGKEILRDLWINAQLHSEALTPRGAGGHA